MSRTPQRLWDQGGTLDGDVLRFTVGDDPVWDQHLVHWDCLGSAAHAKTLARAGLLSDAETTSLLAALAGIDARHREGAFSIPPELEDVHTAIEAELVRRCGQVGEKIHAGRSRNDQVATAMRLFMRHHALHWLNRLCRFGGLLLDRIGRDGDQPMPGYTHLRPAMPSSVGQWLHAVFEAALEQVRAGLDLLERLDACPLGTGAGYGTPLSLDRTYTARLLGFGRVQRSPLDVQNSRGRLEKYFVRVAADVGAVLERFAGDLILFSTPEFGFFELPEALTTGSSIMPQKRNPDVLELLRARAVRLRGRLAELEALGTRLTSGYHRDLQLTKEPAVRTALELPDMLHVAGLAVSGFTICSERLSQAMRPELYAANRALRLARQGMPFRSAYRQVAAEIRAGRFEPEAELSASEHVRMTSALLEELREELERNRARVDEIHARVTAVEDRLLFPDAGSAV